MNSHCKETRLHLFYFPRTKDSFDFSHPAQKTLRPSWGFTDSWATRECDVQEFFSMFNCASLQRSGRRGNASLLFLRWMWDAAAMAAVVVVGARCWAGPRVTGQRMVRVCESSVKGQDAALKEHNIRGSNRNIGVTEIILLFGRKYQLCYTP